MGRNLAKAPLLAVFYAGLIWMASALIPYSQGYLEALGEFSMRPLGFAFLVGYALWVMIAAALVFSSAMSGGARFLLLLLASGIGLQWAIPMMQPLIHGEASGIAARSDLLFLLAACGASTILAVVLAAFLYRIPEKDPDKQAAEGKPKFKIKILGLLTRLVSLTLIFLVLYYLLWYFLLWQADAVREFYGQPEKRRFLEEIIDILLNRGFEVIVVMLRGLAYALFSLPLLLLLPGKRVIFIVVNAMYYSSGAILSIVPSVLLPEAVRLPHLIQGAALLVVFGGISGILLHTALKREEPQPDAAEPKGAPAPKAAGKQKKAVPSKAPVPAEAKK